MEPANPHYGSAAAMRLYLIADLQATCLAAHGDAAGLAAALRAREGKRSARAERKAAKPAKPDRGARCKQCKAYVDEDAHDDEFDEAEDCAFGLCAECCGESGNSVEWCPRHTPREFEEARNEDRGFDDGRYGGRYGGGW